MLVLVLVQVFVKEPSMYAFKGLAGRIGPIGVHASMLFILAGTTYSGLGGCKGSVIVPEVSVCGSGCMPVMKWQLSNGSFETALPAAPWGGARAYSWSRRSVCAVSATWWLWYDSCRMTMVKQPF